ncbi:hypothetical protein SPRG_01217 [Saprolegnia parasitica CBS 223.65]|uniref:Uncharacterized protein n=1 Tax=Saprolegnia parasitica (strain CBS 223.65) TaxID=695850 RepID=A0A067D0Y3_SAPPC|nr:hypothetical protein SPRG_01217 [Saprolegnia parasitica CBS 223.65]KDO35150.1 hypothetical protein SPRG_01217 [Saprolegnia parasitica CBS 223.65]|eukprot:XP_012194797.1 hypothetical protein SPRG_01217 [Saprolegnia parasitica CBS 223.65]
MAAVDVASLDYLLAPRAATSSVLTSRDLFALLAAYQVGVPGATLYLGRVFKELTSSGATLHARTLAAFLDALPLWFERHGGDRIDKLLPGYRRRRLVHYGLILGNVEILSCFEACHVLQISEQDLLLAGEHGHLSIVRFLLPRISVVHASMIMNQAAANGHLDAVTVLHAAGGKASEAAYAEACANGHDHVVRFLHQVGYRYFPPTLVNDAAARGHLGMIQFLHDIQYPDLDAAVSIAADNGHMEIVEFLFERRPYLWYAKRSKAPALASTHEHSMALNLLVARVLGTRDLFRLVVTYQRGCDKATLALRQLLRAIDLTADDVLETLPAALAPVHERLPAWAAARGVEHIGLYFPPKLFRHLVCYALVCDNVPVLRELPIELSYHDLELAGLHGHQRIVAYLIETYANAPHLLRITLKGAVRSGHVEALQQLHDAGVDVPDGCFQTACERGHLSVVEYLYEHHLGGVDGGGKHIVSQTTINGHLPVLRYLHARRFEGFDKFALRYAVELGHLGIVQFLHEIRTEKMYGLVYDAVPGGHLDVVQFLHQNGYNHDIKGVLWYALNKGQQDIARYLQEETALKKRWSRFQKQVSVKLQDLKKAITHR